MYYKIALFVCLTMTGLALSAGTDNTLVHLAAHCIKDSVPQDYWYGQDLFFEDYLLNISAQWDPENKKNYLRWPHYAKPNDWTASCNLKETLEICLRSLTQAKIELTFSVVKQCDNDSPLYDAWMTIYSTYWLLAACEHKSILTDPLADHTGCVHNRILNDDIQNCNGVNNWFRGQRIIENDMNTAPANGISSRINEELNRCIYTQGQWKMNCGLGVDKMMFGLTGHFSRFELNFIMKQRARFQGMCSKCSENSDVSAYKMISDKRAVLVKNLLLANQAVKSCNPNDYSLNMCHIERTWTMPVYEDFCHNVTSTFIPTVAPLLPVCDIGRWVDSVTRVCKMGHGKLMNKISFIRRCTHDDDELFPCYRGSNLDPLSQTLLTAGRVWLNSMKGRNQKTGSVKSVYEAVKRCASARYKYLSQSCKNGPAVAQLIRDLRVITGIDVASIFSEGSYINAANINENSMKSKDLLMC